jgi:mevalonate kinase
LFQQNVNDIEGITNNIINIITSYKHNGDDSVDHCKEKFTQLIMQNQKYLSNIQVSNDIIDGIINVLHRNGFYNCKITGAGGGGFILVFVEKENICKFNTLCKEENFNILKVNIDSKGAYVVTH